MVYDKFVIFNQNRWVALSSCKKFDDKKYFCSVVFNILLNLVSTHCNCICIYIAYELMER